MNPIVRAIALLHALTVTAVVATGCVSVSRIGTMTDPQSAQRTT